MLEVEDNKIIEDILTKNKKVDKKVFNFIVGQCLKRSANRNVEELRQEIASKVGYEIPVKEKKEPEPIPPPNNWFHGIRDGATSMYYYTDILTGETTDFYFWDAVEDKLNDVLPEKLVSYLKRTVRYS